MNQCNCGAYRLEKFDGFAWVWAAGCRACDRIQELEERHAAHLAEIVDDMEIYMSAVHDVADRDTPEIEDLKLHHSLRRVLQGVTVEQWRDRALRANYEHLLLRGMKELEVNAPQEHSWEWFLEERSLAEIEECRVLLQGHTDNYLYEARHRRVLHSRMTADDGALYGNQITVEAFTGSRWVTVKQYEAK
jgi:hypothetical protein